MAFSQGNTRSEDAQKPLGGCSLSDTSESIGALLGILEGIGCGVIVRNGRGVVTAINRTALELLKREPTPTEQDDGSRLSAAVNRLLGQASVRFQSGGRAWGNVCGDAARGLAVYQKALPTSPGSAIVILVDMRASLQPRPQTLQHLFSLTVAEIKVASSIALGSTPAEIAHELRVSRTTVRSQLASIFAKTGTSRQAELVAVLARASLLM